MVLSFLRMRQLITRVDDDLHARLKQRAADEGVSMNALVTRILGDALAETSRERFLRQLEREGRRYIPPQPADPPTHDELRASAGPEAGEAVLEELLRQREES